MPTLTRNFYLTAFVIVAMCAAAFAQPPMTGKIPITTSSEEARQFYLEGRNLA